MPAIARSRESDIDDTCRSSSDVAVIVPAENEPLALTWEPAPLVVWADPVIVDEPESDAAALPSIGTASEFEARAA